MYPIHKHQQLLCKVFSQFSYIFCYGQAHEWSEATQVRNKVAPTVQVAIPSEIRRELRLQPARGQAFLSSWLRYLAQPCHGQFGAYTFHRTGNTLSRGPDVTVRVRLHYKSYYATRGSLTLRIVAASLTETAQYLGFSHALQPPPLKLEPVPSKFQIMITNYKIRMYTMN